MAMSSGTFMSKTANVLLTPAHRAHFDWLCSLPAMWSEQGLMLGSQYVMFEAEAGLMTRHAEIMLQGHDSAEVLDVGAGLGVFARAALELGASSYTGIEPHPEVAVKIRSMLAKFGNTHRVLHGIWQDLLGELGQYDSIMYDTWPPDGYADRDIALFFDAVCQNHLRKSGTFSFFCSGEPSALRLELLRSKFRHVVVEPYHLTQLPPSWTKPTPLCTICVGRDLKR